MSDLVKRLRENHEALRGPDYYEAAATIEAQAAEIERLTGERDDALEQVEELERNAEIVSDEFEKDCWKAMRRLLEECKFDWRDVDPGEGVTADRAYEYIKETIDAVESDGLRWKSRAEQAESALAKTDRTAKHLLIAANEYQHRLAKAVEVIERLSSFSISDELGKTGRIADLCKAWVEHKKSARTFIAEHGSDSREGK